MVIGVEPSNPFRGLSQRDRLSFWRFDDIANANCAREVFKDEPGFVPPRMGIRTEVARPQVEPRQNFPIHPGFITHAASVTETFVPIVGLILYEQAVLVAIGQ
jgi:hypothetical protein